MNAILTWIQTAYRKAVDHLTKVLGAIGAGLMAMAAWISPEQIQAAAQAYLGRYAISKIGAFLFGLVILRGWYTGRKAKANAPA